VSKEASKNAKPNHGASGLWYDEAEKAEKACGKEKQEKAKK